MSYKNKLHTPILALIPQSQVNSESVVGFSHSEAVAAVRRATGVVILAVSRAKSATKGSNTSKGAVTTVSSPEVQNDAGKRETVFSLTWTAL